MEQQSLSRVLTGIFSLESGGRPFSLQLHFRSLSPVPFGLSECPAIGVCGFCLILIHMM